MMIRRLTYFILLIFSVIDMAHAAKITAVLDSVTLLMGHKTTIHLEIVEPTNVEGELCLQPEQLIIPEIEVSEIVALDTIDLGNSLRQVNRDVIIQSFDSGEYIIPAIKYLSGKDTLKSNELAMKVFPVNVSHLETINPIADVEDIESKWYDFLPDFIIDYWVWILLLIVIIIVTIVVIVLLHKKELPNPFKKIVPKLSPYEAAMLGLNNLKEQNLCNNGQEKEYYTSLTDILRIYLQDRFGINAVEMTTTQINRALNENPETKSHKEMIRQILEVADFVKFAKVRPMPEDNVRSFNYALQFVEDTKPAPQVEEVDNNTGNLKI